MALVALLIPVVVSANSYAQGGDDIADIKAELERLKQAYESELARLETRLNEIEERVAAEEVAALEAPVQSGGAASSGNIFNPKIGIVFNGRFTSFSNEPSDYSIAGSPLGGETGVGPEGFGLGETEVNFSSNVSDLFYASTTIAIDAGDDGVEVDLEAAFIQTISLPAGATLKAGRFFAALGYLNENHEHTDNFADRPLPYQAFLASQYNDDGIQLAFVLPTDLYMQVGAGAFRGADFPAGGADNDGTGAYTGFFRLGGDVGFSNSWRLGFSVLHADAAGRETGEEGAPPAELLDFSGNTDLLIADFKYQWSPNGNIVERYFVLQGEFMKRYQDGSFNGIPYRGRDSGFYLEGVYKYRRGLRVGYRYSQLFPEDSLPLGLLGTDLDAAGINPWNHSFMLDWAHNEFSLIRLQYSRERSQLIRDNRFYIQFIMSIGAHAAHTF